MMREWWYRSPSMTGKYRAWRNASNFVLLIDRYEFEAWRRRLPDELISNAGDLSFIEINPQFASNNQSFLALGRIEREVVKVSGDLLVCDFSGFLRGAPF